MTDKQIEIADRILSEMKERNGTVNKDNLSFLFVETQTEGKARMELNLVISFLKKYDLVEWVGSREYTLRFCLDGQKAADAGIVEFLRQRELAKQQHILNIENSNINFGSNSGQQTIIQNSSQRDISFDNSNKKRSTDQPIPKPNQNIGDSIMDLSAKYWWTLIVPIIVMYIYDKYLK
jgi:hypothetical protein